MAKRTISNTAIWEAGYDAALDDLSRKLGEDTPVIFDSERTRNPHGGDMVLPKPENELHGIRELCASAGCADPGLGVTARTLCMVEELRQRGACTESHSQPERPIVAVAYHCFSEGERAMTKTINRQITIFDAISDERTRQEQLKAAGKFVYSCADGGISDTERFTVLSEEVGEVAHELNERVGRESQREECFASRARLRAELIQVAAVCVAWVEALDTNESEGK